MSARISTYLALVLAISTVYLCVINLQVGAAYGVAVAGVLLPLIFVRVPHRHFYIVLFAAGSVWLAYLVRPLILVPFKEMFAYGRVGGLSNHLIEVALTHIGVYSAALVGGLAYGLRKRPSEARADAPRDGGEIAGRSTLLRLGPVLYVALFAALAAKAVLLFAFNVGQKGVTQDSRIAFAQQFMPEELIYALCVLMLARYRHELGRVRRSMLYAVLAGFALLVLLSGSKAFILRIALAAFIYFLATRGDFRVHVSRATLAAALSVVVITASFAIGLTVKHASRAGAGRFVALVSALTESTGLVRADAFMSEVGTVTERFAGLDGLLVTDMVRSPVLKDVFSLKKTALRIASRFVPFDRGAGTMTSGRAVGIYYTGHPEYLPHSGGVGLYGSLQLMLGAGLPAALGLALLGFLGGVYFRTVGRLESYETRFFLNYIGAYAVIRWTMSGNLDVNVPELVTQIIQLVMYAYLFKAILSVLLRSEGSPSALPT